MAQKLVRFETWEQVLEAARSGERLWYASPMDVASAYGRRIVAVIRVYKNGKLRIDAMSSQLDNFTADAGHLYRFFRRAKDEPLPDATSIASAVRQLGHHANLTNLAHLGWTRRDVQAAVRRGEIAWTASGTLEASDVAEGK
jgi:hypothetical protein